MSTCLNCGAEYQGRLLQGGGVFKCPDCFRLKQLREEQIKDQSRLEEFSRFQQVNSEREQKSQEEKKRDLKLQANIKSAQSYLNAGLLDDATHSAIKAEEFLNEYDEKAGIDVAAIYICIAFRSNKPCLAKDNKDSFHERIVQYIYKTNIEILSALDNWNGAENLISDISEIPTLWTDALGQINNDKSVRHIVDTINEDVMLLVKEHRAEALFDKSEDLFQPLPVTENKRMQSSALNLFALLKKLFVGSLLIAASWALYTYYYFNLDTSIQKNLRTDNDLSFKYFEKPSLVPQRSLDSTDASENLQKNCLEGKIATFRTENGAKNPIRQDVLKEWGEDCWTVTRDK